MNIIPKLTTGCNSKMYSVAGVSSYVFAGNQSDTLKVVCTDSNINQFFNPCFRWDCNKTLN